MPRCASTGKTKHNGRKSDEVLDTRATLALATLGGVPECQLRD